MANIKVYIHNDVMTSILNQCNESICKGLAQGIAGRCGDGYASDTMPYSTGHRPRNISSVYTESYQAMADNRKNNTILRNLK